MASEHFKQLHIVFIRHPGISGSFVLYIAMMDRKCSGSVCINEVEQ